MNQVQEIFTGLTDHELEVIIHEIKRAETTGVFGDQSSIRELCRRVAVTTGMDVSSNLLMVQIGVLKEAAYRWVNRQKS